MAQDQMAQLVKINFAAFSNVPFAGPFCGP